MKSQIATSVGRGFLGVGVVLGAVPILGVAATSQTIPNIIANALFQVSEDDGGAEIAYKIFYPTPAGEAYNVDFNTDAAGMTVMGVAVSMYVSSGTGQIGQVAVCADNLALDASGRTPDLASPLSSLTNPTGSPSAGGPYCVGSTTYDVPDVTLGTGGSHAVVSFATNDSNTWMCVDALDSLGFNHTGARHSFFTTDSYATPASYSANKWNYMIRLAGAPATPGGGLFLVDGVTAATTPGSGTIALQFWSADGAAPTQYLEFLQVGAANIPLPAAVLSTGSTNGLPNGIQQLGVLSGAVPCAAVGMTLSFGCFFSDNLDKKKNGQNRIKSSNVATAFVAPYKICSPNLCFGIRDDGSMGNSVFIFNPRITYGIGSAAGSNDAASVHMGRIDPSSPRVTNLTAVEMVSWDFCSSISCWQQIGIYPSNTVLDPSGNTPDLSAPLTSLGGSSACAYVGPGSTWGFPAIVYDTPDVVASTAIDYHCATVWLNGDSCLFIGMDTDGTDDDAANDCAGLVGTTSANGSATYFSLDGYTTPAVDSTNGGVYPAFNLMERIDWN